MKNSLAIVAFSSSPMVDIDEFFEYTPCVPFTSHILSRCLLKSLAKLYQLVA